MDSLEMAVVNIITIGGGIAFMSLIFVAACGAYLHVEDRQKAFKQRQKDNLRDSKRGI